MSDTTTEAATPRVFVSYNHRDLAVAERVVNTLVGIGLRPWIDQNEVRPGDSFVEAMNEGLKEASYVLVLLSPASVESRWVSREWMSTLMDSGTVLLPLIVEHCEVPPLLRDILHIDLREEDGYDKLAAFFRRELSPIAGRGVRRGGADSSRLRDCSPRVLRLVATKCMQQTHLNAFLFDADIDSGDLGGDSVNARITDLLVGIRREGLLKDFADWLEREPSCRRCVTRELVERLREAPIELAP